MLTSHASITDSNIPTTYSGYQTISGDFYLALNEYCANIIFVILNLGSSIMSDPPQSPSSRFFNGAHDFFMTNVQFTEVVVFKLLFVTNTLRTVTLRFTTIQPLFRVLYHLCHL